MCLIPDWAPTQPLYPIAVALDRSSRMKLHLELTDLGVGGSIDSHGLSSLPEVRSEIHLPIARAGGDPGDEDGRR